MKSLLTLFCTIGLFCGGGGGHAKATPMPPPLADLAAKVLPAVVSIASTDPVANNADTSGDNDNNDGSGGDNNDNGDGDGSRYLLNHTADTSATSGTVIPPPKALEALGSGFVFDPAGYVLTNAHVINGASSVTVTFQDGSILPATVVGRDKDGDLAVLKVQAGHKLAAVSFGDSGKLRVGDWVLAVGNPFGLPGSTSAGIVSALDRDINENKYDDFIQTDATINRGNSGGPLFNMDGQVIGINSAIYSPSGGSVGIGFAIPAAMAAPVAAAIMHSGSMERGWLGVAAQEVTPEISRIFGLPGAAGALIGGISPHSPADGKLQAGDNLVALAGVPVTNPRGLMIRTAEIPVGQSVPVEFWRDGALQTTSLTVAAPPAELDDTQTTPAAAAPGNIILANIGLAISAVAGDAGLKIVSVNAGGPAAKAGIVADNTLEQINGLAAGAPQGFHTTLNNLAAAHQPAVLLITGDIADGTNPGPRWVAVPVK